MPRSAWLAVGATAAALFLPAIGPRGVAIGLAIAIGLACLAAVVPSRPRRIATVAIAAGIGLVAARILLGPTAPMIGTPEGDGPWTMRVESVGSPRDGDQVATLRSVDDGVAAFRLAATLPRYPPIEPTDIVVIEGRLRPRPDSDYGRYLERLGAWGTVDVAALRVVPTPDDPGRWLERLRRGAGDALAAVLPEPEAGLAAGILIGLRDRVDRDVAAAFTTSGVSHVVAISGWNIAIVAAAVAAVAGGLARRRRSVVTALAIVAYIAFAGASPSVLRAGAMAGVVLIARESGRAGRAAAALGWAATILLVVDPGLVGDAGFQLSTLATAGLIAWATPLTERLARIGGGRIPHWLAESLGVSLAAQAATLPVVLASFGRLAVMSPLVNLAVVPLVAPAMAAGVVALAGGWLVGAGAPVVIGAVLAAPAWVALRLMIGIIDVAASIPMASLAFEPAVGTGLAIVVLILGGALRHAVTHGHRWPWGRSGAPTRSKPPIRPAQGVAVAAIPRRATALNAGAGARSAGLRRAAVLGLVASLAVTGGVLATRPPGIARIAVMDVGQGDAILLEGSRGGRLLIDGGPDPDRLLVDLDRRIPPWDRRIDAVVLTHPHEDHVAGLALLLDRYRVRQVFEPGMRGPGPGYAAWAARLDRPGAPIRLGLAAGDHLRVDEMSLAVLWPLRGRVPREPPDTGTGINNVSVVLLGAIGDRRFLLAGDVEQDIDPALLTEGLPRVDVLKVAHHGSKTATTQAFVDAVRPRVAIASAGADNPYGHPARSTLQRLSDAGARVYRTDRDGTVTVAFEPGGPTVRTEPRRAGDGPASGLPVAARHAPTPATSASRAFLCALPLAFVPPAPPAPSVAFGDEPPPDWAVGGQDRALGYHRPDDGPDSARGRVTVALPGSSRLVRGARPGRGGGRGLARARDRRARDPRRSPGGRDRGAPARRRQDPAVRRSGAGPPAR